MGCITNHIRELEAFYKNFPEKKLDLSDYRMFLIDYAIKKHYHMYQSIYRISVSDSSKYDFDQSSRMIDMLLDAFLGDRLINQVYVDKNLDKARNKKEFLREKLSENKEWKVTIPEDNDFLDLKLKGAWKWLAFSIENTLKGALNASEGITDKIPEVQFTVEGDFLVVKISDNGTGISRENLKRLSDPDFTTTGGGTGQAVMHRAVRDAGGDCILDSLTQEELDALTPAEIAERKRKGLRTERGLTQIIKWPLDKKKDNEEMPLFPGEEHEDGAISKAGLTDLMTKLHEALVGRQSDPERRGLCQRVCASGYKAIWDIKRIKKRMIEDDPSLTAVMKQASEPKAEICRKELFVNGKSREHYYLLINNRYVCDIFPNYERFKGERRKSVLVMTKEEAEKRSEWYKDAEKNKLEEELLERLFWNDFDVRDIDRREIAVMKWLEKQKDKWGAKDIVKENKEQTEGTEQGNSFIASLRELLTMFCASYVGEKSIHKIFYYGNNRRKYFLVRLFAKVRERLPEHTRFDIELCYARDGTRGVDYLLINDKYIVTVNPPEKIRRELLSDIMIITEEEAVGIYDIYNKTKRTNYRGSGFQGEKEEEWDDREMRKHDQDVDILIDAWIKHNYKIIEAETEKPETVKTENIESNEKVIREVNLQGNNVQNCIKTYFNNISSTEPIDVAISTALIPKEDLEENMRTWAHLIRSCEDFKNANFIFEKPNFDGKGSYPKAAEKDFQNAPSEKDIVDALSKELPQSVIEQRVNRPRRENAIEVALVSQTYLKYMANNGGVDKKDLYPVALEGNTYEDGQETIFRNFEAALNIGLAKAALAIALKEQGKAGMDAEFLKDMLNRLQELYSAIRKDVSITENTLRYMVDENFQVRAGVAINLVIPLIDRMPVETLRILHKAVQKSL